MQPQSAQDYKQLLTEVIKKQIVILGPDITLSKARNVKGLVVQNDGTVTDVTGSPQEVTQALIDQFVQLSGLIVKKTMEPLLLGTAMPTAPVVAPTTPPQPQNQVPNAAPSAPQQPAPQTPVQVPQQTSPQPQTQPGATLTDIAISSTTPGQPPVQTQSLAEAQQPPANPTEPVQPASNPLAA